jgi:hypothetical protein
MKTSTRKAGNFRRKIGKIATALTLISVIGSLTAAPAFARDNDGRQESRDNGRHEGERRGEHRGERHGDRDWRGPGYRPNYVRPYYYGPPVYAPPPVYISPPQSPGISLFFPLEIRHR